MRIFKNRNKDSEGYHYTTTFYKKDKNGNILKKNVFVDFQQGQEPMDAPDYDFDLKAYVNGEEYDCVLSANLHDGIVEGKLFLGKFGRQKQIQSEPKVTDDLPLPEKKEEETEPEIFFEQEDLPFY